MKKVILIVFILFLVINAYSNQNIYRFGIFIGANKGYNENVILNDAVNNIKMIKNAFVNWGDTSDSSKILEDPDIEDLEKSFIDAKKILKEKKATGFQTHFIFYYIGHGKSKKEGGGLSLKNGIYKEEKILKRISDLSADINVLFADSCYGQFMGDDDNDSPLSKFLTDARGTLFISSTENAKQLAKEDLFSSFIIKGLLGEADKNSDKFVTLRELFDYANSETTNRNSEQKGKINDNLLKNEGEFLIADLSNLKAFDIYFFGKIAISDKNGKKIVEFFNTKFQGEENEKNQKNQIYLPEDFYFVEIEDGNQTHNLKINLKEKDNFKLSWNTLTNYKDKFNEKDFNISINLLKVSLPTLLATTSILTLSTISLFSGVGVCYYYSNDFYNKYNNKNIADLIIYYKNKTNEYDLYTNILLAVSFVNLGVLLCVDIPLLITTAFFYGKYKTKFKNETKFSFNLNIAKESLNLGLTIKL